MACYGNRQIYVQLVDDVTGETLVAASSKEKEIAGQKVNKIEQAKLVGKRIAEKAKAKGINTVVFDRNGFLYHGRVKNLADAARESGLKRKICQQGSEKLKQVTSS